MSMASRVVKSGWVRSSLKDICMQESASIHKLEVRCNDGPTYGWPVALSLPSIFTQFPDHIWQISIARICVSHSLIHNDTSVL